MLTMSVPDQGEPSAERMRFINRRRAVLKQYLDRKYGKQPRPVWCNERGEKGDKVHGHMLLGDYGYIDLPKVRKWMVKNGLCDVAQDGRLVPWYIKYELLRSQGQAVRYVAAYVGKGAEVTWPKYARIRYCPIGEKREPGQCGPHMFKSACVHLVGEQPPSLDDRVAIAQSARVDCQDCLGVIRSAVTAWKTNAPASVPSSPTMFSYKETRHRVTCVPDEVGKEVVK